MDYEAPEANDQINRENPEGVIIEEYLGLQTFSRDLQPYLEWLLQKNNGSEL